MGKISSIWIHTVIDMQLQSPTLSTYLTLPVHKEANSFCSSQFFQRYLISFHHFFIYWCGWLCNNPISPHNTEAFRPRCSSFTADSVLLRISFFIACLLCPFIVLWASENIQSAAPLTATTSLALRWCSLFLPVGSSAFSQNLPLLALSLEFKWNMQPQNTRL